MLQCHTIYQDLSSINCSYVYVCKTIEVFDLCRKRSVTSARAARHWPIIRVSQGHRRPFPRIHHSSKTYQHIRLHKMSAGPPKAPGALKQIWYKWKTLRLPWRRQFLAGSDLSGNTFWEFKDALNAQRFRRIVKYAKAGHYSDVKISRKVLRIVLRAIPRLEC